MPKSLSPSEQRKQELLDLCQDLEEHIRLARDYATTPGNIWMARHEIQTLSRLLAELESKISEIEHSENPKS